MFTTATPQPRAPLSSAGRTSRPRCPRQTAAADTPRHGKQSGRTVWTNRGWRRAHGPAQPVAVGVASDGPLGLSGARSLLCNTEQIKTPASPKPQSFRKEQRDGTRESLCDCGTRDRCEDVTPSAPRRALRGPRSTSRRRGCDSALHPDALWTPQHHTPPGLALPPRARNPSQNVYARDSQMISTLFSRKARNNRKINL